MNSTESNWRNLSDGEVIVEGDEIWSREHGKFLPVAPSIGKPWRFGLNPTCRRKLSASRKAIVVRQRSHDWHASIKGESGKWGNGRNQSEAIGDLVQSFPEDFNLVVEATNPKL